MSERTIPLSVPNLKGNELKYVTAAIKEQWVSTSGPYVNEFERNIAEYVHAKGAVSCQNGTSGLHIALLMAGVTKGDAVIVPTLTFIAAVNPVKYIGAEPIFMDCDDSLCMDPIKLRRFFEQECKFFNGQLIDKRSKRSIKAILVVHVFGNMADMVSIMDIAQTYGLKVIEDATEAIGTFYTGGKFKGKFAGTIGYMGVYSFNGNKIITTGGGGMIVSNEISDLQQAKHLTTQAKSDELYYTHDEIGYNYRMTNLQAALGLAQIESLERFIEVKAHNYEAYKERIDRLEGLTLLSVREDIRSNHWFYALYCDGYILDRDGMIGHLKKYRIQSRPIWGLIHEQRPYQGSRAYQIEKARQYWTNVVNIPCSTSLTQEDIDEVMEKIENCR